MRKGDLVGEKCHRFSSSASIPGLFSRGVGSTQTAREKTCNKQRGICGVYFSFFVYVSACISKLCPPGEKLKENLVVCFQQNSEKMKESAEQM